MLLGDLVSNVAGNLGESLKLSLDIFNAPTRLDAVNNQLNHLLQLAEVEDDREVTNAVCSLLAKR
jgi:hypothetical protein